VFAAYVSLQVPTSWCDLWEGPDDPTLYLRSLVGKALALNWGMGGEGAWWYTAAGGCS